MGYKKTKIISGKQNRVHTGKFEYNSRTFQGLLKTILQFSRAKNLGKLLIKVLKFFFKNARLRYWRNIVLENEYGIVVPLFGAAFAAPNKGTKKFYTDLDLYQQC